MTDPFRRRNKLKQIMLLKQLLHLLLLLLEFALGFTNVMKRRGVFRSHDQRHPSQPRPCKAA